MSQSSFLDGSLTDTTLPGQSRPGIDGNKGVIHNRKSAQCIVRGILIYGRYCICLYKIVTTSKRSYSRCDTKLDQVMRINFWNSEMKHFRDKHIRDLYIVRGVLIYGRYIINLFKCIEYYNKLHLVTRLQF